MIFLLGLMFLCSSGGIIQSTQIPSYQNPEISSPKVIINEIAWMGTPESFQDEWLELYNPNSFEVDLSGWTLLALDGSPKINLEKSIPAQGFYLLERTDNLTLPSIKADLIYKGALNNKGEKLELRNDGGQLVDETDCSEGWTAGHNSTKQTMERTSSGRWQASKKPGGTPKAPNSSGASLSPLKAVPPPPQSEYNLSNFKSQAQIFIFALSVAVIAGGSVLLLKHLLNKNNLSL